MTSESEDQPASSSSYVFEILDFVAGSRNAVTPADIVRAMGLSASTVYRALVTLEDTDFVRRIAGTPAYGLGSNPRHLGRALFNRVQFGKRSLPFLRRMMRECRGSAALSVAVGWNSLRIELIGDERDILQHIRLGAVDRLCNSVEGISILSHSELRLIHRYRDSIAQHEPTLSAKLERNAFWSELSEIKKRGFSVGSLVRSPGYQTTAVPLRGKDNVAFGALSLTRHRLSGADFNACVRKLRAVRDEFEAFLKKSPELLCLPFAELDRDTIVMTPTDEN